MSCNTLTSMLKGCDPNLGGIVKLYVNYPENINIGAMTIVDGKVTGIALEEFGTTGGTVTHPFVEFQFNPNTSNYVESEANDLTTGTTVFTQTITLSLNRREAAKYNSLNALTNGHPGLSFIIKDANKIYWGFGLDEDNHVYLTTNEGGSGQAKADQNGYILTFVCEAGSRALEVASDQIAALLS